MYSVKVLRDGYSKFENGVYKANGTATLIVGPRFKVIVDTLSAWDKDILLKSLLEQGVSPDQVNVVVNTHGHPDHVGNNNLFITGENIIHIMGHAIHSNDTYFTDVSLEAGEVYNIDEDELTVFPTPGHTLDSVSVKVKTEDGVVIVAGDTFEKEEDIEDESIWISAGSENQEKQQESRKRILQEADWIVPGHGPMFKNIYK